MGEKAGEVVGGLVALADAQGISGWCFLVLFSKPFWERLSQLTNFWKALN